MERFTCPHLSALTAARSSSRRAPPFSLRERERALGSARGGGPEGAGKAAAGLGAPLPSNAAQARGRRCGRWWGRRAPTGTGGPTAGPRGKWASKRATRSGRAAPAALRRRERPGCTTTPSPQRPGTGCGSVRGRLPLGRQRPSLLTSGRGLPRGSGGQRKAAERSRVRPAGSRRAAAPAPVPAAADCRRPPRAVPALSPRYRARAAVPAPRALSPGRRCARAPARCSVGMAVALGLAERGGQSRFNVRHVGRGVLSGAGAAEERSQRPAQPAPPGPVSERAPPRRGSRGLSMRALGGVRLSARSALAVAPPSPAGAAIAA